MDPAVLGSVTDRLTNLHQSIAANDLATDTLWVVVAAILVMFMQAGFAF